MRWSQSPCQMRKSSRMRCCVGDYDLIICVGAEQVDALTNVASTYPEQRFALLDATSDLPNVASYSCKGSRRERSGRRLAAFAKQEKTDDKLGDGKTIGFIGGVDNPLSTVSQQDTRQGLSILNRK